MNILSLRFEYDGPKDGNPDDSEESMAAQKALSSAEKIVEEALTSLDLNWKHQYCWPDGSLLKWVKTDLDEKELQALLTATLPDDVQISNIRIDDPECNPHKCGCDTLREYMK